MKQDYLTIVLTRNCKESCPFCFIEKNNSSIKKEVARAAVEYFLNIGGGEKTVKFFGGEPLLEFELLKELVGLCRYKSKQIGKRVNFILPTSGRLLDERILDFVSVFEIELILDSCHISKIKRKIANRLFSLPFLTLTLNIFPAEAGLLFLKFKDFYNQGFRRFNLLPAYYVKWPKAEIKLLNKELNKIGEFYSSRPGLYFKNCEQKGDVPLFNSCLTCDVSGDLYSSNIVLFKAFARLKDKFYLGKVKDISRNNAVEFNNDYLNKALKKCFPESLLTDTFRVDKVLTRFVQSLQRSVRVADIKLGDACNNRCKFCVRRTKGQKVFNEKAQKLKRHLRNARLDCQGVVLTGGEVAIREDFFDLVSYAKRLGFEAIQVQTNGRMFAYKAFCQKAIEAGINEFGIAIHGHQPQLHDYLTSSAGSFYQTVQAIKNVKQLGLPVFTNTVINKSNYRHLPQIAQLLVSLGVDQFQFAFVHALGSAGENFSSIVPRVSMVVAYVQQGLEIGIKAGVRVMTEAIPCCLMGKYKDYISEKIIPSTKIYEFDNEIIDFDKIRPSMAKAKGQNCKQCIYFSNCEGVWREYPQRFGWNEFIPVLHP